MLPLGSVASAGQANAYGVFQMWLVVVFSMDQSLKCRSFIDSALCTSHLGHLEFGATRH
jgi:hypothetical protein